MKFERRRRIRGRESLIGRFVSLANQRLRFPTYREPYSRCSRNSRPTRPTPWNTWATRECKQPYRSCLASIWELIRSRSHKFVKISPFINIILWRKSQCLKSWPFGSGLGKLGPKMPPGWARPTLAENSSGPIPKKRVKQWAPICGKHP